MNLQADIKNAINLVDMWEKNFRSDVHCALYNLILFHGTSEMNLSSVYDEDGNEMNVVKIFINEKDETKLYIEYYYIELGKRMSDIISEAITDFPTSTMVNILRKWYKSLKK